MKSEKFSVYEMTRQFYLHQPVQLQADTTTSSTNSLAKDAAINADLTPCVYLAGEQTAGRGRFNRTWENGSTAGDNLLITWSFALDKAPQPIAGAAIGLTLYQALQQIWPQAPWGLKPPNDIYLGDKKVLGVLLETVTSGSRHRLIVGVGLNIFSHPSHVPDAGHLSEKLDLSPSHFQDFLKALEARWPHFLSLATENKLPADIREQLLVALNRCSHNPQPFLEITENGDLVTSSARISWRNL